LWKTGKTRQSFVLSNNEKRHGGGEKKNCKVAEVGLWTTKVISAKAFTIS